MTSLRNEPVSQSNRAPESMTTFTATDCGASIERALHRLAACSSVTGPGLYHAILDALTDALGARWALIGTVDASAPTQIRTVAVLADGVLGDDVEYDLAGTPCAEVLKHGTRCFSGDLRRQFPHDEILHEMGVEYYLGTPLRASNGSLLGLLAIQHDAPLDESLQPRALLELLASRAASSLEIETHVRALERSERNLGDFFDNAAVGLHWVDANGIIIRANLAELEMMGYAAREEEYIGRHITEFHADRVIINDILEPLARGETIKDTPARLIRRDGSIRHVLITSNALFENGRFVHTRCFTRDVTEQRNAEEQLRRSDEFNRRLIDASSDCIKALDLDGRLLSMNEGGRRRMAIDDIAPYLNQDWIGWWKQHHCDAENAVRAAASGGAGKFEGSCRAADGTLHWWEVIVTPILGADGTPERLLAVSREVTERRMTEQALRHSEERFRTLVDMLPAGVYLCAADGTISAFNRRAVELWGREPKIGDTDNRFCGALRLHWPDGRPLPHEKTPMADALRTGQPKRDLEVIIERPDSSRITVLVNIAPLHDERGNVVGAINCFQDISGRKRIEEVLRQREEEFRALAEHSPDIIARFDRDLRHLYVNPAIETLAGVKREALIGRTNRELGMPARLCDQWEAALRAVFETASRNDIEFPFPITDGVGHFMSRITPEFNAAGEVVSVLGVTRDITARRRVERELQAQVAFRQAVENSVAAGLAAVNLEGRKTYVNRAFCQMTGFTKGDLLGRTPPFPYWPSEDAARISAAFEAMKRGEAPASDGGFEMRFRRRDGTMFDALVVPSPLMGADGEVSGWVAAVTDITAHKRTEAELSRHRDQLEELVIERTVELESSYEQLRQSERMAALGTLSAGLGHDMGNLLLPLRLRLDAIERKTRPADNDGLPSDAAPADVREDIEAIRKCAEYMQRLTNGLRLFALDPDDDRASEGTTDVRQWWQDVEPFMKNVLPRGVELERRLPGDLPPVRIPRHLLTQAVFNLVQNAGDALRSQMEKAPANESSRPPVCVCAEMDRREGAVRISVCDAGAGMTADVRKRCMEPFFTTKPRGLSTGLGLALVHGIALRSSGRMEIDSTLGKGTTITLVLPACESQEAAAPAEDGAAAAAPSAAGRGHALVSVADPRMRAFTTSVLRALSIEVHAQEAQPTNHPAGAVQYDIWLTDDAERVNQEGPRLFAAGEFKRIVLIGSDCDTLAGRDERIVLLDSAERKPDCWRALRSVVSEIRKELKST